MSSLESIKDDKTTGDSATDSSGDYTDDIRERRKLFLDFSLISYTNGEE